MDWKLLCRHIFLINQLDLRLHALVCSSCELPSSFDIAESKSLSLNRNQQKLLNVYFHSNSAETIKRSIESHP